MSQVSTITTEETLTVLREALGKHQKFLFIKDDDRIVLEPLDDDDDKPYYELTPEGEKSLKEAIAQAERGEVYPIDTLFQKDV